MKEKKFKIYLLIQNSHNFMIEIFKFLILESLPMQIEVKQGLEQVQKHIYQLVHVKNLKILKLLAKQAEENIN